jgi:hypothetical protein
MDLGHGELLDGACCCKVQDAVPRSSRYQERPLAGATRAVSGIRRRLAALDLTPTQLKLLEPVQGGFHPLPMSAGYAPADPVPALHEKFLPLPVGLEVEGGNDPIPDENRAHEIAEDPLVTGKRSTCPPGSNTMYVQMVGKPLFQNRLSNPAVWNHP